MEQNRTNCRSSYLYRFLTILAGALSVYLIVAFLFPYHLAHREQYTLSEWLPTEPLKLTLYITSAGICCGWILRRLRLPRWIVYPLIACSMWVLALHACDIRGRWFYVPSQPEERILAIDTEAHRNNWTRVQELTVGCEDDFNVYYHNLSLAHQGMLADSLLHHSAPFEYALFYPIDETGNYMSISAAGEVWWYVKDLTMAEHAAMLGQIFSPYHQGRRPLQRLYEINVCAGNQSSADKFARILQAHNVPLPQVSPAPVRSEQDTLRLTYQYDVMLRSTLERNPQNKPALEYLLCLDLLWKNLNAFQSDIQHFGLPSRSRLYQEAMLILMDMHPELREPWHDYIDAETYQDFVRCIQGFESKRSPKQMSEFRTTYWYYYRFHSRKQS